MIGILATLRRCDLGTHGRRLINGRGWNIRDRILDPRMLLTQLPVPNEASGMGPSTVSTSGSQAGCLFSMFMFFFDFFFKNFSWRGLGAVKNGGSTGDERRRRKEAAARSLRHARQRWYGKGKLAGYESMTTTMLLNHPLLVHRSQCPHGDSWLHAPWEEGYVDQEWCVCTMPAIAWAVRKPKAAVWSRRISISEMMQSANEMDLPLPPWCWDSWCAGIASAKMQAWDWIRSLHMQVHLISFSW